MQHSPSLPNTPKRHGEPHLNRGHIWQGDARSHCFLWDVPVLTAVLVEFSPSDVSHVFWVGLFVYLVGFVCLLCFLVLLCWFFFPPLDAVLVGSEGDGKRSTMGTCREHQGTTTRGRSALPRLGSYSLMNLLVRNFTVSAAGGGGGWHGHPTEQRAVTGIPPHHPTLHLHAAVGPFTPLPICLPPLFPAPKHLFFPKSCPLVPQLSQD